MSPWARTLCRAASERTFDDLERPVQHAGHVEADLGPPSPLLPQVRCRQAAEPALLRRGHGFERIAVRRPGPGLHLTDDQGAAPGTDQVDFARPAAPVPFEHGVPVRPVMRGSELLAEPTECGVAPVAVPHRRWNGRIRALVRATV